MNAGLRVEDQAFPQSGQVLDVGRYGSGMGVLPPLALLFFLVGFRRGSVFCLRHAGMIALIPSREKPLGLEAGRTPTASYWSIANSTT